jgi:putative endonuclease
LERRETGAVWSVYFLELSNHDIYVGSTNDLRRRFASYQAGQVTSTKKRLPVALKSYVAVENEKKARQLERYFKSGSGKAFAKKRFLSSPNPKADWPA